MYTSAAIRDRTAAPYPDPVPISSTRAPGLSPAAWVITATMYGCEIVCPSPIGSGRSSYANRASAAGTKRSRGTARMASSTSGSVMPRASIWVATMRSSVLGQHRSITSPARRDARYSLLIGIVVPFAAGVLGSVTISSPFLNVAVTLLPSTATGSRTPRVNAP